MHNFLNQPWVQTILSMDDVVPTQWKYNQTNTRNPRITPIFLDEFYDEKTIFWTNLLNI